MLAEATETQRFCVVSYVVHFTTYGPFQSQKVNFDNEEIELELEYFLCIYKVIFGWI